MHWTYLQWTMYFAFLGMSLQMRSKFLLSTSSWHFSNRAVSNWEVPNPELATIDWWLMHGGWEILSPIPMERLWPGQNPLLGSWHLLGSQWLKRKQVPVCADNRVTYRRETTHSWDWSLWEDIQMDSKQRFLSLTKPQLQRDLTWTLQTPGPSFKPARVPLYRHKPTPLQRGTHRPYVYCTISLWCSSVQTRKVRDCASALSTRLLAINDLT